MDELDFIKDLTKTKKKIIRKIYILSCNFFLPLLKHWSGAAVASPQLLLPIYHLQDLPETFCTIKRLLQLFDC